MGRSRLLVAAVGVVAGIGCANGHDEPIRSVRIAQEALGDAWPFTADAGVLRCQGGAVTFRVGNTTYGLNPVARQRGAAAPFPIWMWAGGPATDTRVSLTPLVERGLELCE